MAGRQWRFILVEEPTALPVLWQQPRHTVEHVGAPSDIAAAVLIAATRTLRRRGLGPEAWVAAGEEDPVAFLMDAVDSPVRLWSAQGELVYQNSAADRWTMLERLGLPERDVFDVEIDGVALRRRVLSFHRSGQDYTLEIISQH